MEPENRRHGSQATWCKHDSLREFTITKAARHGAGQDDVESARRAGSDLLAGANTEAYQYPEAMLLARPDVGTQAQFKKKKPPATYRYDSSLSPSGVGRAEPGPRASASGCSARSRRRRSSHADPPHTFPSRASSRRRRPGAGLGAGSGDAVDQLKGLSRPFLNWAGKAERLSFDVPTLPLFVHERLSTKAIIETLKGHRKRAKQTDDVRPVRRPAALDRRPGPRRLRDPDGWINRMILGDSLVVMNSLLHYENLGGQVQMIYMDPPYGVKFGSNFQPFVRKRDVKHNDDEDMTREPEMVQAYRDTWELGLHSLPDVHARPALLCPRTACADRQHLRADQRREPAPCDELMDEVFGAENSCQVISFRKKTMPLGQHLLEASTVITCLVR